MRCSLHVLWLFALAAAGQTPAGSLMGEAYWKTDGTFVGSRQCAGCHPAQVKSYAKTTMSRALILLDAAGQNSTLPNGSRLEWRDANVLYSVSRQAGKLVYRVTRGTESFETPLLYAFGEGMAGQTYVFSKDGKYYESRVSYYADTKSLDRTVGSDGRAASTLLESAGRLMDDRDVRECFGCHTTGARNGKTFQLQQFEAGVECENCHGPGGAHIAAKQTSKPESGDKLAGMRSWRGFDAQDMSDACGACHRTWEKVLLMGVKGVNNVRFAPYRLTMSKCFAPDDKRISCTACHDPHGPLETETVKYDSKCLACHAGGRAAVAAHKAGAKACPKAVANCASCHMPKVLPPETHHAFVDHRIRVVRNDIYPD